MRVRPLVACWVWSLGACSPAAEVARDAGSPFCHWDCFGGAECRDGVVTVLAAVPVPCEQWTGACPKLETWTCSAGCNVEGAELSFVFFGDPAVLCAETPDRQPGDSCQTSDGRAACWPIRAQEGPDAQLTTTYLACDDATDTSVPAEGPELADYGAICDPIRRGTGVGFVASCPSDLCLQIEVPNAGCRRAGCTFRCSGDQDCPSGSYCDDSLASLDNSASGPVCRPGPRDGVPTSLPCLPG